MCPLGDPYPSLYILKGQGYKQSIIFGTISCSLAVHADQRHAPHVFLSAVTSSTSPWVPAAARPDPARREGLGLVAWQHSVGGPSRRRDAGSRSRAARRRIQGRAGDEGRTLFLSISFTHPSLPLFISLTLSLLQIQWSRGRSSEAEAERGRGSSRA